MKEPISLLPKGYEPLLHVDLQKNKKLAWLVNGLAILCGVAMAVSAHFVVPIGTLFDMSEGWGLYLLRFGVLLIGMVVYMILHEGVHGIAMKLCGTKRVHYGFTGLYAFAGSEDYYGKGAYLFIALAPVVLWGLVLAVAGMFVPTSWFWVVYAIQIVNISGAAGDAYVTVRFARLPKDILVRDAGTSMVVYAKQKQEIERDVR